MDGGSEHFHHDQSIEALKYQSYQVHYILKDTKYVYTQVSMSICAPVFFLLTYYVVFTHINGILLTIATTKNGFSQDKKHT